LLTAIETDEEESSDEEIAVYGVTYIYIIINCTITPKKPFKRVIYVFFKYVRLFLASVDGN